MISRDLESRALKEFPVCYIGKGNSVTRDSIFAVTLKIFQLFNISWIIRAQIMKFVHPFTSHCHRLTNIHSVSQVFYEGKTPLIRICL